MFGTSSVREPSFLAMSMATPKLTLSRRRREGCPFTTAKPSLSCGNASSARRCSSAVAARLRGGRAPVLGARRHSAVATQQFREIGSPGFVHERRVVAKAAEQAFDVSGIGSEIFGYEF